MRSIRPLLPSIYRIYPGLNRTELEQMPCDEMSDLLADLATVLDLDYVKG